MSPIGRDALLGLALASAVLFAAALRGCQPPQRQKAHAGQLRAFCSSQTTFPRRLVKFPELITGRDPVNKERSCPTQNFLHRPDLRR